MAELVDKIFRERERASVIQGREGSLGVHEESRASLSW